MTNDCQQPPANLPTEWGNYVHPNCFKNIERLGKWTGGTTVLGLHDSPEKYFASVVPDSIGAEEEGVNLYVVTHGWGPGLRTAVDKAQGKLKWWNSAAYLSNKGQEEGKREWSSSWAWTGTKGQKHDLDVSPTGLLQQIEIYEAKANPGKKTIVLAYSWVDDSGTVPLKLGEKNFMSAASRSEAYTNLNGLRLAAAIQDATATGFFNNPKNKLHVLAHSHGTKVATIACLNLQMKGLQVDHLTILDPAENWMCLETNVANLLGYYFGKMKIAQPAQIGQQGFTFVENYISFFGQGLAGPTGSNINNIRQVGLESEHVFDETSVSQKHAYAASWFSNAQAEMKNAGLAWPPVLPDSSSNYYQKFPLLMGNWKKDQWILHPGNIDGAGVKTKLVSDIPVKINEISKTDEVQGSAASELVFRFKDGYDAVPATYVGSFAVAKELKGISFDLQWSNPRPNEFIVITVESIVGEKQQIAIVLDASAFKNTGNANGTWHPISFNSFALVRDQTKFEIHYFPGKTWKGQYGNVRIKNFCGVQEE